MAPSLPSCIGNAFCSHRQASWFLLATLIPFFFPILVLCVPFLLLFLVPLSFFLLSLLLLYKVQASIRPKRSRIPDKGVFLRQPGFAEESFLEEDKERRRYEDVPESEDLDGENLQRSAASEGGDGEVLHAISSVSSESTGEEHVNVKDVGSESMGEEHDDVKEAPARHEWDEKQEGGNVIEGIVENREEGLSVPHRDRVEDECSQVLVSPVMEGMPPRQEGKAMEVQEEVEGTDEHSRSTSSDGLGEGTLMHFPSRHEQGSSYSQPEETILEDRGADLRKVVPTVQSGVHAPMNEFDEGPSKDVGDEIFEIAPHHIHEEGSSHLQPGEAPEVGSESIRDEHDDVKEAYASQELDNKQEGNVIEGMVENREEGLSLSHRDRVEDEGVQVVASPSTGSVALTKQEQDDMMEGMSPKQDGKAMEVQQEDRNLEDTGGNFQDEHSMSTSSDGLGEGILTHVPYAHEQGSSYSQPGENLSEEHGADLGKDLPTVESGVHGLKHLPFTHEQGSLYSQPEEALSKEQGVVPGKDLPTVESGVYGSMDEYDEGGPSKDGADESFEIDPHRIHEQGSSHFQPGETPPEEQGIDLEKDLPTVESGFQGWMNEFDEVPSKHGGDEVDPHRIHGHGSPHFQPEATPPEEQGIGLRKDLPTGESGVHGPMNEFEEGPLKDGGDAVFEIGKRHTQSGTQEHNRGEPGLFFEKPSGSGSSDFKLGRPEKQELLSLMEKEMEEGEPSSTVTDIREPWRADAFAKELQDDAQSQQGRPVSDLGVSTQSKSPEWDHPLETSSSLEPSTQGPLEDVESQDKLQEKHRILADIYAIKKIIGYQGEDHASLMEQITALYLFLGMEPYEWDVGVDDLEKARAEVELLKVVVGVK